MQDADAFLHLVARDQAGDPDLGGADHLDVDAGVGQGPEHASRDARRAQHPGADDRQLRDAACRRHPCGADRLRRGLDQLLGRLEVRLRDREREVGAARTTDVLNDDVDRDAGRSERLEDRGGDAGPVGNADHCDLRYVAFLGDSSHALSVFHRYVGDDHGTHAFVEARPDVDRHAVELADLDRPRMNHARAHRGQLEHLVVLDVAELARGFHKARIRSEDSIDVGVDLARAGIQRGSQRDRRGVGAAAAEGRDLEVGGDALEAGDHGDLAVAQRLEDALRLDVLDPRPGVLRARANAGLQARERDRRNSHALQAHRNQRCGDRLAVRHQHVELAGRRLRVDALCQRDQAVRGVTHRGNHRDDLVALLDGRGDAAADPPDAGGGTHGGTTVFLDDDHSVRNMPLSVICVTSAVPRSGKDDSMAAATRAACEGAQKANTLGPAPQMAAP